MQRTLSMSLATLAIALTSLSAGAIVPGPAPDPLPPPLPPAMPVLPGLNSDYLDGLDAADFAAAGHDHDGRYYTEAESDARFLASGAKAADSDKLDGLDSARFLRSDASGTLQGDLRVTGAIRGSRDWTGLTFGPSVGNVGGGFNAGQFRVVGDVVCLRGGISLPTGGDPRLLALLPEGARPPATVAFATAPTHSGGTQRQERVDVSADGAVTLVYSDGDLAAHLDGICFSTSA